MRRVLLWGCEVYAFHGLWPSRGEQGLYIPYDNPEDGRFTAVVYGLGIASPAGFRNGVYTYRSHSGRLGRLIVQILTRSRVPFSGILRICSKCESEAYPASAQRKIGSKTETATLVECGLQLHKLRFVLELILL